MLSCGSGEAGRLIDVAKALGSHQRLRILDCLNSPYGKRVGNRRATKDAPGHRQSPSQ